MVDGLHSEFKCPEGAIEMCIKFVAVIASAVLLESRDLALSLPNFQLDVEATG